MMGGSSRRVDLRSNDPPAAVGHLVPSGNMLRKTAIIFGIPEGKAKPPTIGSSCAGLGFIRREKSAGERTVGHRA
jgi:hypothetical protein